MRKNIHYQIKIWLFDLFRYLVGKDVAKKIIFISKKRLIRRNRVIFIHIPKAAGTSIATAIYGDRIGHYRLADYVEYFGGSINDFAIFAVVRDPLDRLISAYNYSRSGGTEDGAYSDDIDPLFRSKLTPIPRHTDPLRFLKGLQRWPDNITAFFSCFHLSNRHGMPCE